jgi:hypothetical protein
MTPLAAITGQRPLAHESLSLAGCGMATGYARELLESLGGDCTVAGGRADAPPAITWARSGLMSLTGRADGAPQMCPAPLASCADGVTQAIRCLASRRAAFEFPDGSALLGERAAIAGLRRNGAVSPGGACRLLRAADSWIAVSLARDVDWSDVPAWLERDDASTWSDVERAAATRPAAVLVERARLLGLPACVSAAPPQPVPPWCTVTRHGPPACGTRRGQARVVDLSSLWAGPLCTHLLQVLGADVVKVESLDRPDGARSGPRAFYDLLNSGKPSLALRFDSDGVACLQRVIDQADIVVEASRPRGLRQLGVIAEECIARRPGLTWISITGYGRGEPEGSWTAFGDDAGVAAGASALLHELTGTPLFCGDAIADPLAGMHATLAALAGHRSGGGCLWSLPMRDVVAHCLGFERPADEGALRQRWERWRQEATDAQLDSTQPVARQARSRAADLGVDTGSTLARWGIAC